MEDSEKILFEEKQHFRQIWLWIILLGVSFLLTYEFIQQVFLGSNPTLDLLLILSWIIFAVGFPYGFYKAELITRVYDDRICIQLFPLHLNKQCYNLKHIKGFDATTYRPIIDYGGWGIRYGLKGKAYNISGKGGVKLRFQTGRPLLIGSQKPKELTDALEQAKNDKKLHH